MYLCAISITNLKQSAANASNSKERLKSRSVLKISFPFRPLKNGDKYLHLRARGIALGILKIDDADFQAGFVQVI